MKRRARPYTPPSDIIRNSQGQTLVEYMLVLILIAVVAIAALTIVGQKANNTYSYIGSTLPQQ